MRWALIVFVGLGLGVGCLDFSGSDEVDEPQTISAPEWVLSPPGVVIENGRPVYYGRGEAKGIRNPALARAIADNRARAAIARLIARQAASAPAADAPRADRADRSGRADRADRSGRADRADRSGRADRADRADSAERADRAERDDRADRAERAERAERRTELRLEGVVIVDHWVHPVDGTVFALARLDHVETATPAAGQR